MADKLWDSFLCHATEDKADFVDPLAQELRRFGLEVWYDKFVLKVGDSLRRKVEEGLSQSRFGVVVLSHAFFGKNWGREELDGLFTLQMEGESRILPVWHGVTMRRTEFTSLQPDFFWDEVNVMGSNFEVRPEDAVCLRKPRTLKAHNALLYYTRLQLRKAQMQNPKPRLSRLRIFQFSGPQGFPPLPRV
jgi:TIR domain